MILKYLKHLWYMITTGAIITVEPEGYSSPLLSFQLLSLEVLAVSENAQKLPLCQNPGDKRLQPCPNGKDLLMSLKTIDCINPL